MGVGIQHETGDLEPVRRRRRAHAAQCHLYPGDQLLQCEGLDEVVVAALGETADALTGGTLFVLTDVQRTCLADAGVQRPKGKLTTDQAKELRAAIDAALAKCAVKVPDRLAGREKLGFRWAALGAEQQQCLADVRLTRPVGRLTEPQRAAVRQAKLDAVKACGIGR